MVLALAAALAACGDDGGNPADEPDAGPPAPDAQPADSVTREEVVTHYADMVHANYEDALAKAKQLQAAIETFLTTPSAATFESAKRAWLEARVPYGQTEAYRFYDGPIDNADNGPEGQLNAWPMDEAYVDYVLDPATPPGDPPQFLQGGIINDATVEITKEKLAALNEGGEGDIFDVGETFDPEKAVSTGYHAIEFLLWGQDFTDGGPGSRPFQDYLVGPEAPPNGERRGQYLRVVTELLIDDLTFLVAAWAPDMPGNYRDEFVNGDPDQALRSMLSGIGILGKGELASERMDVALSSLDQEDEHSCFSDNTHTDILMNATGIQNVYLGRYGYLQGPSVSDLVRQLDPELDLQMRQELEASLQAVLAIPVPFDQAIPEANSESWLKVEAAVNALFAQSDTVIEVGQRLGLGNISVDLPE
jgi:putative iron-regulated protein